MSNETRKCNSCGTTLPAEAAACSKCGAKQHTEPSTLSSFELLEDGDLQEISPPAEAVVEAPEPSSAPKLDSLELDSLELHPVALDRGQDSAASVEAEAVDEIELEEVAVEPPSAPEPPAVEEEESEETAQTVQMSMHDVVQVWNEEAEAETHSDPASTTLGEADGLPKGFWVAIIACVLILASALVLLLG